MKLKNALYAGVLMSVALFASCTSDDNDGVQLGGNGIQFSASIKGQTDVTTRAHDASWDENDQIGIFATNAGASAFTASNVQYKTSANGNLLAVGQPVSFKDATTKADFKAYYPYTAQAANGVVPVNVANQSNQAAIDLLYSNDATGKSAADAKVDLTFSHQLVKLALSIKAEDGVDVKGLALKVGGTSVSGSFDIAKGALTQDAAKQDVALKVAADNSAAEGIILPAASLNGVTLSVSNAAGTTKTVDLSALKTAEGAAITSFAAGSKYIFAVNLSKGTTPTDFTVKFGSASIKDWTTVPGGDINIDFGGEGGETPSYETVAFPYTEAFSADMGKFKIEDKAKPSELASVWSVDTKYGYVKATAYDSSSKNNYATESMLVSPVIDMTSANNPVLTFSQAVNYFTSIDVAKTQATVLVREEGGEWKQAAVDGYPSSLGWNFAASTVDLSAYKGKKIQVAFKYVSTSDKAGTWELKDVSVAEKPADGEKGSESNPYTVAELIAKQDGTEAWVKAYIVGYNPEGSTYAPVFGIGGKVYNANIIIAGKADETNVDNVVPVQLPSGDVRNAVNLKDNPKNLGKAVLLYGTFTKYFGKSGLKTVKQYKFVD